MSREINLNRQKLGLEDLLFGVGIVTQIRAGQSVNVTRINAGNLPFDETQSLFEWAQSINIVALGSMTTELQAIYDNLTAIGNVEDNLTVINTLEDNLVALNSLYTNISKLQNIDTNMSKLQNIDTNMSKLQNIDTNMSKLQAIYTDLTKLESIYDNLTMVLAIYNNLTALNNINSQVIPNLTELLLVNDNAIQVAADKLTVATDKDIVAGYKEDVSAMKVAVETIYDTFDDRFLGVKTSDPTVDNDGNSLLDGAMYFHGPLHILKVYSLTNTEWYAIPQLYLSALLDVTLTSVTTGDILTWNGTKWVNTRTPSFDSVKLNGGTSTAGTATWNNTELTYDLVLNDNVTLQVGQEEVIYCKNSTTTTIPNGKPVMAIGTNGDSGNILIALHDGTKASAKRIIGITTEDLTANGYGFVTRNGKVRGLNTTGSDYGETWADGDILYVKATGALTKVEPADTALKMPIAFVIHAHTNGTLYVRTTGIDENHDRDLISTKVSKVTSTDSAVVRFNGTTGAVQNSGVTIDDNNNLNVPSITVADGKGVVRFDNSNMQFVGLNADTIFGNTGAFNTKFYTNNTERLRIDSAGNIGIGTSSPGYKVDITNASGGNMVNASYTGGAKTPYIRLGVSSDTLSELSAGNSDNTCALGLKVNGTERARIDSNGNVGIGTTAPERKLEVQSYGVGAAGILRISGLAGSGSTTNSSLLELSITGAGGGTITQNLIARYNNGYEIAAYFTDRFALRDNTTNTERFAVDSSGNIFVPSAYLNTTASATNMFVDSTGKFYRSTSSKKYKTNIEPIDISYIDTFFNYARPIYYKSLSENDNPNWGYWGFIAEEIAEFDKRLVHWRYQTKEVEVEKERIIQAVEELKDEEGNIIQESKDETVEKYIKIETTKDDSKPMIAEGVMYERITVLLTAKVQEQQKIIDTLIGRLEVLEGAK